jgi:galactose mutarotase-like enzyme
MTVRLTAGEESLLVEPAAGGRITSLLAAGRERLVTEAPDDAQPEFAHLLSGMFLMAPWVGRLRHGRFEWHGRTHRFPVNLAGHAIHGLVAGQPWRVARRTTHEITVEVELRECGWPFDGLVTQRYRLEPGRLTATAAIAAREEMPVSLGWHPWLARPATGDIELLLDAERVLVTDDELIPTGATMPAEGDLSLRTGPRLGSRRLDHAYVAVRGPAIVRLPDWLLEITFSETVTNVVVFTPARACCIEGQTAWPNAHALIDSAGATTGLSVLEPGASLIAAQQWAWWPRSDAK